MQNYEQILQELGIEIPKDKKDSLKQKMEENYRPVDEYNEAVSKRDEYKQSLDDVQQKLDGFKDVDVEELKAQISTLTTQLNDEKTARAKDAAVAEMEKKITSFFSSTDEKGEPKFVFMNDITEDYYRNALMQEMEKDSAKGKSINEIFNALITGEDGKQKKGIFVEKTEVNRPRFTQNSSKAQVTGSKISPAKLMQMKNENPDLDIRQYM